MRLGIINNEKQKRRYTKTWEVPRSNLEKIDGIANHLKWDYSNGKGDYDWDRLAKDLGVSLYENEVYIQPIALWIENNPKIFCKGRNTLQGDFILAHEFAHVILNHNLRGLSYNNEEGEADYFAEIIVGYKFSEMIDAIQGIGDYLRFPLVWKAVKRDRYSRLYLWTIGERFPKSKPSKKNENKFIQSMLPGL